MKLHYFYPLAGHVIVTLALGFGQVIPGTCVSGLNALSVGFAASVAGTCLVYWLGVRIAVHDRR